MMDRNGLPVRQLDTGIGARYFDGRRGVRRRNPSLLAKEGIFITVEGIDGTGKTTQLRLLASYLRKHGYKVLVTREPGGTRIGEKVREILLSSRTRCLAPRAELLLLYAARAQHLEEVIQPALRQGWLVISDRFNDASFAYQGFGRKLGWDVIKRVDEIVCGTHQPQLTLLLDAPVEGSLIRALKREGKSGRSRFEEQGLAFQRRVRRGYLEIARRYPERIKVIPAGASIQRVQAEIRWQVDEFLALHSGGSRRRGDQSGVKQTSRA
jgi:dTMP kinase